MPKIKTHKATSKRITITKTGKLKQRKGGQDHFNSRETGNTKRKKRRDITISKSYAKVFKSLMPY
ncbi:50S ribosomal protein L35 [Patescibacteria group bacterium]|nr:50S ribosomal protein L35 [Patescibacteria group bacterium]